MTSRNAQQLSLLGVRIGSDELPALVKQARQRAGMTQAQAGASIGMSLRSWQDWESGARGIQAPILELWLLAAAAEGRIPKSDPLLREIVRPGLRQLLG